MTTVLDKPEASEELKKLGLDVKNALTSLQDSVETKNKETLKNVEVFFHKFETENQKLVKDHAQAQKSLEEFADLVKKSEIELASIKKDADGYKSRVDKLETLIATGNTGNKDQDAVLARKSAEYENFFKFFKGKSQDFGSIDMKTLRSDSDTQGAYLVPQIMDNEIRKYITEMSPVRLFARGRVAPGKTMDIPIRLALPTAYFEGENEQDETGNSTYGSETITLYRQSITVPATHDMMVSAAFDLEREISSDVGEALGLGEGLNFVRGSGNKGPQGFMVDSRIEVVDTASSGAVAFDDLAELSGKLKRGQMPMWYFNRRTLSKLLQIKSTIGVPVWTPVAGNNPAMIWGYPYSSDMIHMDDAQDGAGAKPIMFADMRRLYEIFDFTGISVIRDDVTLKRKAITEWTFRRYLTCRVIVPEAGKIMRVKA